MKTPKVLLIALAGLAVATGCQKEFCESEVPELKFESFQYVETGFADSLIIKTSFKDCNGDIGVKEGGEGFSIFTYQYELINGEWKQFVPADTADTSLYFIKVPYSEEIKEGRPLEGTIEQRLGNPRQNSDTVRFETQMQDRAGNRSERIVTDVFVFPH